jgi:hypothetical protein
MNRRIKSTTCDPFKARSHSREKCLLPSSCPSARISRFPTGRISVKFYTENFYDTLLRRFKFDKNQAKMSSTLHGDLSEFYCCR